MKPFPELPKRKRSSFEVEAPNLGLYLGRSGIDVPARAMADCSNVRIRGRKITNVNVGGSKLFETSLGNQCLLLGEMRTSVGANTTIFGTKSDLFRYDQVNNLPVYITPIYATGTIATTNASPNIVGTGTLWLANVKVGDKISIGSATETAVSATWYTVLNVVDNTHITLSTNYSGTTAGGKSYTVRKLFTANDLDFWDWDIFPDAQAGGTSLYIAGDRWIATNGHEVVAWDGSSSQVRVISTATTGLGFSCTTVQFYKNMMLYGGITEGSSTRPGNFKNSALADPENVTTLEANEYIVAQSVDFLIALRRLGDYVVGYCKDSVNVIQFVEAPFYFAIRTAGPRIGPFSARTIVNFGDFHEFIAKDQAYKFDGVRFIPYANHVFDEVLRRVDRDRAEKAVAAISEEEREVYWILPLVTDGTTSTKSCETAWTEHYAEEVGSAPTPFAKRDLPATAMGSYLASPNNRWSDFVGITFDQLSQPFVSSYFSAGFPTVLFGDEDGYIWELNTQTGLGSSAFCVSSVTTPTRPLAGGESIGVVRRVEPFVERNATSGNLLVSVSTYDRVESAASSQDKSYPISQDPVRPRFAPFRIAGRYANIYFETQLAADQWTMSGYRVTFDEAGER